jgi:hypothetical protein
MAGGGAAGIVCPWQQRIIVENTLHSQYWPMFSKQKHRQHGRWAVLFNGFDASGSLWRTSSAIIFNHWF